MTRVREEPTTGTASDNDAFIVLFCSGAHDSQMNSD